MTTTQDYVERLSTLRNPSPELRAYIAQVQAYDAAGGCHMVVSDEIWKEALDRKQAAWDAVPEREKALARRLAN